MIKQITVESSDRFNCLLIGQSGIGKTSLLRTISPDEPVFVVSAESGLLCVRDLVRAGRVQGFEVENFTDLAQTYDTVSSPQAAGYKWLFIDSLTEISDRCVEAMKAKYPNKSDSFPMWGEYTDKMTALIKAYRDLKQFNVVFTCLDSVEKDENKKRYVGPLVAGTSLRERIASWFDEVFYMVSLSDAEGKERRLLITQPWEKYPGKDRSGKLALAEEPNLSAIKDKILS